MHLMIPCILSANRNSEIYASIGEGDTPEDLEMQGNEAYTRCGHIHMQGNEAYAHTLQVSDIQVQDLPHPPID